MNGFMWIACGAVLVALAAAKPRDSDRGQEPGPGGKQEEELTYVYQSHTKVIGQKDFEIAAKVSILLDTTWRHGGR